MHRRHTSDKELGQGDESEDVGLEHDVDFVLVDLADLFLSVHQACLYRKGESSVSFTFQARVMPFSKPTSRTTENAHIVDEDVHVLELVRDPVEQALDGGSVLHVEREASDDAALAGRAFFVRCEGGLFHFFELGLAAGGEDQGSAGASKGDSLQGIWVPESVTQSQTEGGGEAGPDHAVCRWSRPTGLSPDQRSRAGEAYGCSSDSTRSTGLQMARVR